MKNFNDVSAPDVGSTDFSPTQKKPAPIQSPTPAPQSVAALAGGFNPNSPQAGGAAGAGGMPPVDPLAFAPLGATTNAGGLTSPASPIPQSGTSWFTGQAPPTPTPTPLSAQPPQIQPAPMGGAYTSLLDQLKAGGGQPTPAPYSPQQPQIAGATPAPPGQTALPTDIGGMTGAGAVPISAAPPPQIAPPTGPAGGTQTPVNAPQIASGGVMDETAMRNAIGTSAQTGTDQKGAFVIAPTAAGNTKMYAGPNGSFTDENGKSYTAAQVKGFMDKGGLGGVALQGANGGGTPGAKVQLPNGQWAMVDGSGKLIAGAPPPGSPGYGTAPGSYGSVGGPTPTFAGVPVGIPGGGNAATAATSPQATSGPSYLSPDGKTSGNAGTMNGKDGFWGADGQFHATDASGAPTNTPGQSINTPTNTGLTPSPAPTNTPAPASTPLPSAPLIANDTNPTAPASVNQITGNTPPPAAPPTGSGPDTSGMLAKLQSMVNGPTNTGVGVASGNYATTPENALTNQTITAPAQNDPFKIAQDQWGNFQSATDPQYQADLRDALRAGAAAGGLGSGQLRTSLGDLANQRNLQLDTQRNSLLNNALTTQNENAYRNTGIAQQQQGFQSGQQQTAFNQDAATKQLNDQLLNSSFGRQLQTLLAGSSGNPADTQLALSQIFGNQSSAAGQSLAALLSGMGQKSVTGTGSGTDAFTQWLNNLLKSGGTGATSTGGVTAMPPGDTIPGTGGAYG